MLCFMNMLTFFNLTRRLLCNWCLCRRPFVGLRTYLQSHGPHFINITQEAPKMPSGKRDVGMVTGDLWQGSSWNLKCRAEVQGATWAEECRTARAVDLFVNVRLWCHYLLSPSVSSACVMWGEVSPCHHHARDQPAVCVYRKPSQALRRRGGNDTEALSSNPCGVICTSVNLIDDYWSNTCLWK